MNQPTYGHPPATTNPAQAGYRAEIDGLRAIAVLAVILFHFSERILPRGFLGVDVFFVISGYVITASLYQLPQASTGQFLAAFYARRIRRLVPALALCIGISSILICLFNPQPGLSLKTGLTALFGLSNLYLLRAARFYFAESSELNIFTNTWSLGVEEQFYLVFPLLFHLLTRGDAGRRRWLFPLVIAGIAGASLLLFAGLSRQHQSAAFFLMPPRFWELGAGCLVFTWRERLARQLRPLNPLLLLALLVGVLGSSYLTSPVATITCVLITALLIARLDAVERSSLAIKMLTSRMVVYPGLLSYALYLWHWSILTIARWTVGIDILSAPFLLLLTLLLAISSYHLVERPLRHRQWPGGNLGTIGLGLLGLTAMGGLVMALHLAGSRLYLGEPGGRGREGMESRILATPSVAELAREWEQRCLMTPHLRPGSGGQPRPVVDAAFIENCLTARPESRRLILVGDSFAGVSAPHLAAIARQIGFEFRIIYGFGCPYPLPLAEIRDEPGLSCQEVDEQLLRKEILATLRAGDLLVIRLYLPRYQPLEQHRMPPVTAYDRALARLRDEVLVRGARLLVIGANPTPTTAQIQSLDRQWFNRRRSVSADLMEISPLDNLETTYFHQIDDHLRTSIGDQGAFRFFSVKPWLCNRDNLCRLTDDGHPLYAGDPHLTPYAHDLFFASLAGVIGEMAAGQSPLKIEAP